MSATQMRNVTWGKRELCGTLLLICCAVLFVAKGDLMTPVRTPTGAIDHWQTTDFFIFDTAAQLLAHEPVASFYDMPVQHRVQMRRMGVEMDDTLPFIYPPYIALPFFLVGDVPLMTEYRVWLGVLAGLSFILAVLLLRMVKNDTPGTLVATTLLMVTSLPWILATAEGQAIIVMVLGVLGAWMLIENGWPVLAGALLVLTSIKPQISTAPAIFLVFMGGPRAFLSAAVTGITLLILCTAIFGVGIWHSYAGILHILYADTVGRYGIDMTKRVNFTALVLLMGGMKWFSLVQVLDKILWPVSLMLAAYMACRLRAAAYRLRALAFACAVVLGTFCAPVVHQCSLLMLVIPLVILLKGASRSHVHALCAALLGYDVIAILYPSGSWPVLSVMVQMGLIGWAIAQMRKEPAA